MYKTSDIIQQHIDS